MDKSVRDYTVGHFRELIGRSSELGAKIAVVHPALEPTKPEERATRVGYSQESMAKLAEIAAGYGMTAAVEDLPPHLPRQHRLLSSSKSSRLTTASASRSTLTTCLRTLTRTS